MRKLDKIACPRCGQVMEQGYVYSPRQILWSVDEKNRVLPPVEEWLVGIPLWKTKKVAAYRCGTCKIATFEY